jgi:hypothetical protein
MADETGEQMARRAFAQLGPRVDAAAARLLKANTSEQLAAAAEKLTAAIHARMYVLGKTNKG